jgi:AcrR family transcriptional regulator
VKQAKQNAPERKKRDRKGTENLLLNAAAKSFSQSGFDAATTKSIADLAGVSEGLIHRYFGNKEGLLLAIMRSFLEDSSAHPALSTDREQGLAFAIQEFFKTSMAHHDRMADTMRVVVSSAIIDRDIGKKMGEDIWNRHVKELSQSVRSYKKIKASKLDTEAAGFVLSAFSFVLGFMGPHVFKIEKKRLHGVSDWLADTLAKALQSG